MVNHHKKNSKLTFFREGLRIFSRNIVVKIFGLEKYPGNDEDICREIIRSCYDYKKKYFRTSAGNYKAFYSRDFGWCVESLMRLGYTKEIHNTLEYALKCYSKNDEITVAISREGVAYNFPDIYSPDSTAYLFRSLRIVKSKKLINIYRKFLDKEIVRFEDNVIDKDSGMIKKEIFSGMRDYAICKASCYDMIMACMLCEEIEKINELMGKEFLRNTLKKYDLKKKLIKYYWTGTYFRDGLQTKLCSGHANVYPYLLDIITDKSMLKSSLRNIQRNNLDKPFPLKYGYDKNTRFIPLEFFAKNWEKDTIWTMLGMAYIQILSKIDKKKAQDELIIYKKNVEYSKGFIELYENTGKHYTSLFYTSDNSMLWAAIYLNLKNELKI
ncbi:MAG: hypothetical protein ACP5OA_02120 [Candidatus Woesearchaeota archaeon]